MARKHAKCETLGREDPTESGQAHTLKEPVAQPRRSTARALLKHAGTWVGDDAERCLKEVYAARGETAF